ncbi:MAG: hypothetical protein HY737_01090 [Candidatus Omnitrophica bacterium]|nr:hypothetical protein [Candidatus Omnitrophota bacterium]
MGGRRDCGRVCEAMIVIAAHQVKKRLVQSAKISSWCYLGTDLATRTRISALIPQAVSVSIGEPLNDIALELKSSFVDWIAAIGDAQRLSPRWWGSKMASKVPVQTDLFLLVCYSQLIRAWGCGERVAPAELIVVEDPWLFGLLRRHAAMAPRLEFRGGAGTLRVVLDALYWLAKIPWSAAFTVRWALQAMMMTRASWRGAKRPKAPCGGERGIFLYTWIEPRSFTSDGTLHDPYTGRLMELLTRQGERVRRLTPIKVPQRLLARLRRDAPQTVLTARYLRLSDVLLAGMTCVRIRGVSRHAIFRQLNYTALLHRELLREWGDPSFAYTWLFYRAMRRLAREWKDAVKCVIYPFENQPWEKLLCLAFRQEASSVRLIGYQHALIQPLWLSYFPGKTEFAGAPMPDRVVTNGPVSFQLLRAAGYPAKQLVDGGALRYEHLFSASSAPRGDALRSPDTLSVLVALPISQGQARALLHDLLELFSAPWMDERRASMVRFIVKPHPDTPIAQVMGRATFPAWFTLSEEPLTSLLAHTDVYLAATSSSARWEAHALGLPVLKYTDEFIDLDRLELPNLPREIRCSRQTMKSALASLHRDRVSRPRVRPPSRQMLEQLFSPVNADVWSAVVA